MSICDFTFWVRDLLLAVEYFTYYKMNKDLKVGKDIHADRPSCCRLRYKLCLCMLYLYIKSICTSLLTQATA